MSAPVTLIHVRPRLSALICATFAALCGMRCTSSSTAVTAPSADKCEVSVANAPSSFTASGGQGSVTISTGRDCTWSVAAEAPWVVIAGEPNGQGDAVVPYTVATNPVPTSRSGAISVGAARVQLNQAAAPCRYQLSRGSDSVGAGGGVLSVDVTTLTGCGWTATTSASWIAIASGRNGSASGTVRLNVAANSGAARVGQLNVGGETYTVSQEAPAVTPAPAPTPSPTPSPSPTPAPAPAPTPTPTPPPAGGQTINLSGRISSLSGTCPEVSFEVDGRTVITSAATDYDDGRCSSLSNRDRVRVSGRTRPDGRVDAQQIEFR
jgi:hypothetical protein